MRAAIGVLVLLWCAGALADPPLRLEALSLEELMEIEVSLASRRPEPLAGATAAVAALTRKDLAWLGARHLPEALRWMPGLQVGRIDANKWEVSSRGFSGLFTDKLQVLVDGRSVYTPLFSGVFWEVQDVVLEDVDRIEAVRGPGGALWGANAVNGVINVISKGAAETQGGWVQVGGGSRGRGTLTARYGGRLSPGLHYRVYGQGRTEGDSRGAGLAVRDGWRLGHAGGRVDWQRSPAESFTLEASAYRGRAGQSFLLPTALEPPYQRVVYYDATLAGGAAVGRWKRRLAGRGDLEAQLFVDRMDRRDAILKGLIDNADLDLQHRLPLGGAQELIWGLGYRLTADDYRGSFTLAMLPSQRRVHLLSGFVQDEVALFSGRGRLTAGTKVERNSRTGFEWQPSLRLGWYPVEHHTVWAAVSRATRTPSRADDDIRAVLEVLPPDRLFAGSPVARVALLGNRGFRSEELGALEGGYRGRVSSRLLVDAAVFLQRYDRLRSNEPELPYIDDVAIPVHLVVPLRVANGLEGRTYGGELTLSWQQAERWRVQGSYSYLDMDLWPGPDSQDRDTEDSEEDAVPRHQWSVRSLLAVRPGLELGVSGRYASRLAYQGIDPYLTADLQLRWRPLDRVEVSLLGENLLDSPHLEYVSRSSNNLPAWVTRELSATMGWRF